MDLCKGCGTKVLTGSWCKACYHEFHESEAELAEIGNNGEEIRELSEDDSRLEDR